jgi:hypothetical protein
MNDPTPRRRNHLIWIGSLVAIFGLVSYFVVFARYPALRDTAWLNLLLVLAGLTLSVVAIRRRLSFLSVAGALLSLVCAVLLAGYVFVLSEQLPGTAGVVAVGAPAPDFSLTDQSGATVSLSDFSGRPLVLVFYRGFW